MAMFEFAPGLASVLEVRQASLIVLNLSARA
jgi:hypothetical protein